MASALYGICALVNFVSEICETSEKSTTCTQILHARAFHGVFYIYIYVTLHRILGKKGESTGTLNNRQRAK